MDRLIYIITFIIFPIIIGIIIIRNYKTCKTRIEGTYIGCSKYINSKNIISYYPKFEYYYQNIKYNNESSVPVSSNTIKEYVPKHSYPIWINGKRPYEFLVNKGVPVGGYLLIIIGLIFICMFVLVEKGYIV